MQPEYTYAMAFLAGLLGSGHCIGMCGGLVSAFFLRLGHVGAKPLVVAAYHGGRIGVYTVAGGVAGALGLLLSTGLIGKLQGILQIAAGVIVILLGLDILGKLPWRLGIVLPTRLISGTLRAAGHRGPVGGALLGGIINGLMPCSLTLAVAVKAATAGGPAEGALLMLAFGIGTLPAMLSASLLLGRLGTKTRGRLLQLAALFVIGLGIATISQGVSYFNVMKSLSNG